MSDETIIEAVDGTRVVDIEVALPVPAIGYARFLYAVRGG